MPSMVRLTKSQVTHLVGQSWSTRWAADSVMSESLGALYGRAVTPPSPGPAALRLHPVRQRKRCRNWPGTRLAEGRRLAQEWRLRGRRGGRTTQSPDLMGLDRGAECRRNCPGNGEEVREEPGLSRQGPGGPAHSRPPAPAGRCSREDLDRCARTLPV